MAAALCACGAPTTPRSPRCRRCTCRQAQARYVRTKKGKAARARYCGGPVRRAAAARYRASAVGQRAMSALNARRIYISSLYRGRAQTIEQAALIQRHIQERTRAFKGQQTRA